MIDTHCHLTFPDYAPPGMPGGVGAVLERARAAGVTGCITICTTTQDCARTLALARAHERLWCSAGVHPLYAHQAPHVWENLAVSGRDPLCVAWGEMGLDRHHKEPPLEVQRAVLDEQLAFLAVKAREGLVKPIVLHCREAFDDLIPVLGATSFDPARFVFHCFTGNAADMRKVLDFGAMVSFTGVVTYRNAPELCEAARLAPLERIMVETDAPYLSPHPHRGVRPCEPWMASVTAKALADLRGEPWEQFHEAINENTRRFYGVPAV